MAVAMMRPTIFRSRFCPVCHGTVPHAVDTLAAPGGVMYRAACTGCGRTFRIPDATGAAIAGPAPSAYALAPVFVPGPAAQWPAPPRRRRRAAPVVVALFVALAVAAVVVGPRLADRGVAAASASAGSPAALSPPTTAPTVTAPPVPATTAAPTVDLSPDSPAGMANAAVTALAAGDCSGYWARLTPNNRRAIDEAVRDDGVEGQDALCALLKRDYVVHGSPTGVTVQMRQDGYAEIVVAGVDFDTPPAALIVLVAETDEGWRVINTTNRKRADERSRADLRYGLLTETGIYMDEQRYTTDAKELEKRDQYGRYRRGIAERTSVALGISVVTDAAGQTVCLSARSPSGRLFMIKSIATGDRAGTTYAEGDSLPATCDDAALNPAWTVKGETA